MKSKFIVVSNRLPISVSKTDGKLQFSVSSGGLATALASLNAEHRIWIGWPGLPSDDLTPAEKTKIARELKKHGCYPVHLTSKQIALFYEGYANDTLWPLFHYFQSFTKYSQEYWDSYREVNKLFMQATKRCAEPDALVWVQDYHLMLLPKMLREQMPELSIGYFHHIPFPSYEIYRLLPERKEILEGLLGCDLIGFHIYDYARHFMSSVLRIIGASNSQGVIQYDGRPVRADAYPIGIDYAKFRDALDQPSTLNAIKTLKDSYLDQKIVLSVDRLDYSKGIPERLDAFKLYLKKHPEMRRKVKLVMIAVPSRTEVETYKQLRDQIERAVSRINGEYGTIDWAPISYQFQNLDFTNIVALYAHSDVALVTPIRDGMNLVAKEFVASKTSRNPGVLILSEMTGAADELYRALVVNPNDTNTLADTIHQALAMPKLERLSRQKDMQTRIGSYTVKKWGADFVGDLKNFTKARLDVSKKQLTRKAADGLRDSFVKANQRLVLLDYDGTVKSFVSSPSPDAAKPSKQVVQMLSTIAHKPNTMLAMVSGRTRQALSDWFHDPKIALVAEHGAWMRINGEWSQVDSSFASVKKKVMPLLEAAAVRTAGAIIEEKNFSLVWHFRNAPPELAYVRANDLKRRLKDALEGTDVGVYSGQKILEIKPKNINKGIAARDLYAMHESDFVLVAGDDYTDEHMFGTFETHDAPYTIKIGPGETQAHYQLATSEQMVLLLESIAKLNPSH